NFHRADFWEKPNQESEKSFFQSGRLILLSPIFLVTRAGKVIKKLPPGYAGLISHDFILLQAPGDPRRFGKKLADIMTVRPKHLVFVVENVFQIQTVGFLKGLLQKRNGNCKTDEVMVIIGGVATL